jgi:hypothetical protein
MVLDEMSLFDHFFQTLYSLGVSTDNELYYSESEDCIEGKYLLVDFKIPDMVCHHKAYLEGGEIKEKTVYYRPQEVRVLNLLRSSYPDIEFEVSLREEHFSRINLEADFDDDLSDFFNTLDIKGVEVPTFGKPLSYVNIVIDGRD